MSGFGVKGLECTKHTFIDCRRRFFGLLKVVMQFCVVVVVVSLQAWSSARDKENAVTAATNSWDCKATAFSKQKPWAEEGRGEKNVYVKKTYVKMRDWTAPTPEA